MKKYTKPIMTGEIFTTNEYIAACWLVKCNGPRMGSPKIYNETNGVEGLQTKAEGDVPADTLVRSYSFSTGGCGTAHGGVLSDKEPIHNGYWVGTTGNFITGYETKVYDVFWWNAATDGADDYHESLLNTGDLATNPNAS